MTTTTSSITLGILGSAATLRVIARSLERIDDQVEHEITSLLAVADRLDAAGSELDAAWTLKQAAPQAA